MSNDVESIVFSIDRLSTTLLASHNGEWLTWSNVGLSVASFFATIAGVWVATRALRVNAQQSLAAQQQSLAANRSVEVSSQAIEEQVRSEKQSRNLQTLLHCQSAYKSIEEERLKFRYSRAEERASFTAGQVGSLFRNYWTLKSDKMDYWLSGFVDYDSFLTWNISSLRHFVKSKEEPFFVIPFTAGWAHYGRPYHQEMNPLFVRFTDAIQYHFRARVEIEPGSVFDVIEMIREIDKQNLRKDGNGRTIRRFGSPENLDDFEKDLRELQDNMKGFLTKYLPDHYDIRDHGEKLKKFNPLA